MQTPSMHYSCGQAAGEAGSRISSLPCACTAWSQQAQRAQETSAAPRYPHSRELGRALVIGNSLSQSLLHYRGSFYILSPLQLHLVNGKENIISQTSSVTAQSWLPLSDNRWLPVVSAKPHHITAAYLPCNPCENTRPTSGTATWTKARRHQWCKVSGAGSSCALGLTRIWALNQAKQDSRPILGPVLSALPGQRSHAA